MKDFLKKSIPVGGIILLVLILIKLFIPAPALGEDTDDKAVVWKIVQKYLQDLQKKDFKALAYSVDSPVSRKRVINYIENFSKGVLDYEIRNYRIKDIKVEGSIAFVTVEEDRKFTWKRDKDAEGLDRLDTDYKKVKEVLVLIKRDGKWKFDAYNTINPAKINIKGTPTSFFMEMNSTGVARAYSVFMDPDALQIMEAIVPQFAIARSQGTFTQCQCNMKNIGTALEMYSVDNAGHYPTSLSKLTPDYIRIIPTCAAAGKDTYSGSYTSVIGNYKKGTDAYTFYCKGHNHKDVKVPLNYPQYNSTQGLIPRP